jgi:ribonuclease-3
MNLAWTFRTPALLQEALTHSSWRAEHGGPDNERLEFLGDAALGLAVTELLLAAHPDWAEGRLSVARTELVNASSLAALARRVGVPGALRLGRGAAREGVAAQTRTAARAMEAVIGALYLDGGLEAVRAALGPEFEAMIRSARGEVDPVTALQERAQAGGGAPPTYVDHGSSGPAHQRCWSMSVRVGATTWGPCEAPTKQEAREAVARLALAGGTPT